jgi:hypothetical protein
MNRVIRTVAELTFVLLAFGCGASSSGIPAPDKPAPAVDPKVDEARIKQQMEMMQKSTGQPMQPRSGQTN